MKKLIAALVSAAYCLAAASPTAASPPPTYSECTGKVLSAFYSKEGFIWINITGGGAAVIDPTDQNREAYLSILLTARATDKTISLRFNHEASTCTIVNYDVIGIWLP